MDMAVEVPKASSARAAESLKLEHQFLRVPLEHLKKTIRANHRAVEKEVSAVLSSVSPLPPPSLDAISHLSSLVSHLQGLKRKLEEGAVSETLLVQRCHARLEHLDALDAESQEEWERTRLKRILVDYLLRKLKKPSWTTAAYLFVFGLLCISESVIQHSDSYTWRPLSSVTQVLASFVKPLTLKMLKHPEMLREIQRLRVPFK